MKIAFVSDNGTTISRHFGRACQYIVVHLEAGQEHSRESRAKDSCHGHHHHAPDGQHVAHGHHHEHDEHRPMLAVITDCDLVVAGGMGAEMDQRLRAAGLRTIRTRVQTIDQAIAAFLAGDLHDSIELVH